MPRLTDTSSSGRLPAVRQGACSEKSKVNFATTNKERLPDDTCSDAHRSVEGRTSENLSRKRQLSGAKPGM
jgi:hypothetical protein